MFFHLLSQNLFKSGLSGIPSHSFEVWCVHVLIVFLLDISFDLVSSGSQTVHVRTGCIILKWTKLNGFGGIESGRINNPTYCIVASRSMCYYSENQNFCFFKSRILTCCNFFLGTKLFCF